MSFVYIVLANGTKKLKKTSKSANAAKDAGITWTMWYSSGIPETADVFRMTFFQKS
jgi:hypothetical protein